MHNVQHNSSWAKSTRHRPQVLDLARTAWASVWFDGVLAAGLVLGGLWLYIATLLPGLGSRDTAELQWVVPTLSLAHPTGYPLYTLLGWLWCQLPFGGTPAWRMNLFSAVAAAATLGVMYGVARALGQRRAVAVAAILTLAVSQAFWSQATIAEVYALAALLQALLLLALLRWRSGAWPLWPVGLFLGLAMAHHRSVVLLLPGGLLFIALHIAQSRRFRTRIRSGISGKAVGAALLALAAPLLLYSYVPLRAPAWMQSWQQVFDHITGASLTSTWLNPARLRTDGWARALSLFSQFVWPQFLPAGAIMALLGAVALLRRDRAVAALVVVSYGLVFVFCAAYYVADIEVFFIPAHQLAALLIGEGVLLLLAVVQAPQQARWWRKLAGTWQRAGADFLIMLAMFILPAFLLRHNLPLVRALNTTGDEQIAREIMAQPLPSGALIIGDWYANEGPHYLQVIEHQRPDVQIGSAVGRAEILAALQHGRTVYLAAPDLSLGLVQVPEGRLWRVVNEPLVARTNTQFEWQAGIMLTGYTLEPGSHRPGAAVPVLLEWEARARPNQTYWFFVHLVGPDGHIWGQVDLPPTQLPTERWQPGARYADLVSPVLKSDTPPGTYHVTLGWYAYPSMQRLSLAKASADYITLGDIEVGYRAR